MGLGPHFEVDLLLKSNFTPLHNGIGPPCQSGVFLDNGILLHFAMGLGPHSEVEFCLTMEFFSHSKWDLAPISN